MRSIAVLGVALGVLAGCATPSRFEGELANAPILFQAEGRLSITAPDDLEPARSTNLSGKFAWIERERSSEISFSSPFGDTLARLQIEPGRVELRTPGSTQLGSSPDDLLASQTGMNLPIGGLRWWMRGLDKSGQVQAPESFSEDGWQISYPQMDGDKPRLVRLERSVPQVVQVRIVVDRWGGAS
jgi:outer membrane lipoprotein LolB